MGSDSIDYLPKNRAKNRGHPRLSRLFVDGAREVALPANPGTAHTESRAAHAYCAHPG
jgi:hypothetical protein